jgi:hypothetical protein
VNASGWKAIHYALSQPRHRFLQDLQRKVNVLAMRCWTQDREPKPELTVERRRGEENASVALDGAQEPPVVLVRISSAGNATERNN